MALQELGSAEELSGAERQEYCFSSSSTTVQATVFKKQNKKNYNK